MHFSGKRLLGFLVLNCLFVGCSSLQPIPVEADLDADESPKIVSRGTFVVTDLNRYSEHSLTTDVKSWSSVQTPEVRTDIFCRIFRVRPKIARNFAGGIFEGASRNLEMQGRIKIETDSVDFILSMSYRRQSYKGERGQGVAQEDQITKSLVSNGGITLSDIDPMTFNGPASLPFDICQGSWEGVSIRVQCTRDESLKDDYPISYFLFGWLGWGSTNAAGEKAREGITAFRSPSQVFQIVDDSNRILGKVSKKEYQVFDSVPIDKIPSMTALLGVIRSTQLFYEAVYDYRSNWGPETGAKVLDGNLPDFEFSYR